MFRDLLSSRLIQAGLAFFVLVVSGSLLYSWHVHRTTQRELVQTRQTVQQLGNETHTPEEAIKADIGDFTDKADFEQAKTPYVSGDPNTRPIQATDVIDMAEVSQTRKTVQTSSNPFFTEGVPEHLQCPEEWIGTYLSETSPEALTLMRAIAFEVIEKYNPNRPITDIWDPFIEADKAYLASADPLKGTLGVSASRYDWLIQQSLDFPEIITLYNEDQDRFGDLRRIELGIMKPDWNVQILPDGREFRAAYGYYYTVISRSGTDDNYRESRISFGHSGTKATPVTIDLSNTSDAELERLSGWNYNINPYTTGLYQLGDNPRRELGDYQ